jgi:hypothetical protein
MTFNIHQSVVDRDGMPREKVAEQYKSQLSDLFTESPEGQALLDEDIEPGWTDMVIDFGINYFSVTPATMSPDNLREILFSLFPRKVSAEADDAPEIIHELQYFWKFLEREFHLKNAAACLKVLDDKAANRLKEAMSNPANFGIAKSFIMMGNKQGFDMSTEEGIQSYMETYNAGLAAGTQPRIPLPGEQPTSSSSSSSRSSSSSSSIRDRIRIISPNRAKWLRPAGRRIAERNRSITFLTAMCNAHFLDWSRASNGRNKQEYISG